MRTRKMGLLGLKVGMTQIYDDQGKIAPVTVLQVGPCPVLQIRAKGDEQNAKDGYDAVQVGFLDKPRKNAKMPERGHVSNSIETRRRKARQAAGVQIAPKADCEPQRHIREFRLDDTSPYQVGQVLTAAEVFKDIKNVDVVGTSKGHGFTGAMKRWGFAGLPASHGAKKVHRSHGSVGSLASNRGSGRPKKGKKMPGQHGNSRVTVRNLIVVKIDADNHLVLVRGAVPGHNGALVMIRPTNKVKI